MSENSDIRFLWRRTMKKEVLVIFLLACLTIAGCKSDDVTLDKSWVPDSSKSTEVAEIILSPEASNESEDESRISDRTTYAGEPHLWQEVSITIPDDWEGKYVITEEANGFSIFQRESKEKNETMGFLCGVYRSEQFSGLGVGETLAAYTDEGILYYVMLPTDVTCYTEDPAISAEYAKMMELVPWIAGSLKIASENVHYDASQFKIPVSSIMLLNEFQLMNFSDNELWIARNEIYARHGKIFQNEYLSRYFNTCSWYKPVEGKSEVSDRELNEVEITNIKMILNAEKAYAAKHSYPKKCLTGEVYDFPLEGEKTSCRISYRVTTGDDWEYTSILTIDGEEYNLDEYVSLVTPVQDGFYVTDISVYDDGLEIAILDDGASDDPVTYFFTYNGKLHFIGSVEGFPFRELNDDGMNGFSGQNTIVGSGRVDLIETAYVDVVYRYDIENQKIIQNESGMTSYKWYTPHELYIDIPVYISNDEDSPMIIIPAQKEVFFMKTDGKEWILVRGSDGMEGYIQVKDGVVLNIGLPATEVFSDLYFFD